MKISQTSILGVLTILAALSGAGMKLLNGEPVDFTAVSTALTAGIGLIKASDSPTP